MPYRSSWAAVPPLPALPAPPDPDPIFCCPEALRLFLFANQLYDRLITLQENPTQLQVDKAVSQSNDALLQLSLRWFSIRSMVTKDHKNRQYSKDGYPCIYTVYVAWFERILRYQQEIKPPPLALPPKQPAKPRKSKDDSSGKGWLEDLAERLEQGALNE